MPVAVPEIILLYCIGKRINPESPKIIVERITPLIPKCFPRNIANGTLIMAPIAPNINCILIIPTPLRK